MSGKYTINEGKKGGEKSGDSYCTKGYSIKGQAGKVLVKLAKKDTLSWIGEMYECPECKSRYRHIYPLKCGHTVMLRNKNPYIAMGIPNRALKTVPDQLEVKPSSLNGDTINVGNGLFARVHLEENTIMGDYL
jgi:hypothetical protein